MILSKFVVTIDWCHAPKSVTNPIIPMKKKHFAFIALELAWKFISGHIAGFTTHHVLWFIGIVVLWTNTCTDLKCTKLFSMKKVYLKHILTVVAQFRKRSMISLEPLFYTNFLSFFFHFSFFQITPAAIMFFKPACWVASDRTSGVAWVSVFAKRLALSLSLHFTESHCTKTSFL